MLFVGQAALRGDLARYAKNFDLLELSAEPGRLPKLGKLGKWPEVVGPNFVFSLRLPQRSWQLDKGQTQAWTDHATQAARALGARFVVVQTPATATPTARTRSKLTELKDALGAAGAVLAWEPHGVWEAEETVSWASELGMLLVRDLSRDDAPPGPTVYTRLLALGEGRSIRAGAAERVGQRVRECEKVFVVLEGGGALRAQQLLRRELAE